MRVLVVEDHAKLALAIAAVLRREGMAADVAFDGSDALEKTAASRYDVIVLDRDLPGVHGDEVCRPPGRQRQPSSRILMLTAAGHDRGPGRRAWILGADDYLPKPFDVRRAGRPYPRPVPGGPGRRCRPILACGDLRLDPARRAATRGGPARWR